MKYFSDTQSHYPHVIFEGEIFVVRVLEADNFVDQSYLK